MTSWTEKKKLSLAQQHLFLSADINSKGNGTIEANKLIWRFEVTPTLSSRAYLVRIEYSITDNPNVFVEKPDIQLLAGNRSIPHVYDDPLRLCLYMPKTDQWNSSKRLDETIIPWTYIWLFYFEEWLESDDWKGKGKHPTITEDSSYNRHARRRSNKL